MKNTQNDNVKPNKQQRAEQKRQIAEEKAAKRKQLKDAKLAEILAKAQQRKQERLQKEKQLTEDERLQLRLQAIAERQKNNKKWYKLDNAALMYPMISREEGISVVRRSVLLNDKVDAVNLLLAVNDICGRFPTICGCVKNGWFWPFIDKPSVPIVVKKQTKLPGRPMKLDSRRSQIRVNYYENQIAVEFFHSATDGTGGIIFLNSLVRRYFQLLGIDSDTTNCCDYRDTPSLEEIRDNFAMVAVPKNPPPCPKKVKSVTIKGTPLAGRYMCVRGICSASELQKVAHEHSATITEFIGAVQLLSLAKLAKVTATSDKNPIRILVPVNLRKMYNVETVRNFSNYIFYQYNGQDSLDEVIADVKQQVAAQMTDDYFRGMVSFNYNSEQIPFLKIVPLPIKRLFLGMIINGRGDGTVNCSTLSNLGVVKAPKEFSEHVLRYDFMLGKPAKNTVNFTVATYNDVCVISQINPFAEKDCEKTFFRTLAELGIHLAMESDIWEDAE